MRNRWEVREFLNPDDKACSSSVVMSIEHFDNSTYSIVDALIEIRDCNRCIELHFDLSNSNRDEDFLKYWENNLQKISILRALICEFEARLRLEYNAARRKREAQGVGGDDEVAGSPDAA